MVQAMTEKKTQPTTYVYKKEEGVQKRVGGYKKELTYEERLKQLSKYEPVIPQAPTDMKFHYYKEDGSLGIRAKLKMIESVDELKAFAERCKGQIVGLDTETTGLTFFKDRIVGFSMALNDMEGYYVPIRHQVRHTTKTKENKVDENGNFILTKTGKISTKTVSTHTYEDCPYNLPDKECLDILYKIMLDARVTLWHNSDFDLNMLKGEGYDVMKCKTFDTLILPYIYDAEGKNIAGLKELEKRLLGRYRPGFKETVGDDENFQYTDPTISYEYAAIDACHDEQTEVLTQKGWVLWKDYDGVTPLATSNLETNHFEWQSPTRIIKYPYEGNMYYYKNKTQDWCVTPNHNMLVHRSQDVAKPVEYKRADSLNVEETIYTGATEKQGKQQEYQIGDYTISEIDLARLTALILADGWTQKYDAKTHRSYDTGIVYSENKNYTQISSFLKHLDFPNVHIYETTTEVNSVRLYHWTTHYKPLWDLMRPYTEGGSRGKYVPEFIKEMSAEAIREFITFYGYCDGHKQVHSEGCNTFSMCICTVSPYLRDDLQELLCMIGIPSMLGSRPSKDSCIKGRIISAENCAEQYFIQYNSRKTKRIKKPNMQIIPYKGMVYCAEVPNHTLITRRNGKVLVSGNCSTIAIYHKLYPMVKDLLAQAPSIIELDGKKYNIIQEDNNLIRAFVDYYDHATLKINSQEARDYEKLVKEGLAKTSAEIFEFFGRGPFSLSTGSKEFKGVMADFNIDTGLKTDSGAIAFGKKGIKEFNKNLTYLKNTVFPNMKYMKFNEDKRFGSKLPKKDQQTKEMNVVAYNLTNIIKIYGKPYCKWVDQVNNMVIKNLDGSMATRLDFYNILKNMYQGELKKLDVLKKIQQVSSYNKALNSYIAKLTEVDSCHMHYRLQGTASGRMSSGNSSRGKKTNEYYINLNAQNLTKPKSSHYKGFRSSDPDNILGWKFEPVTDEYAKANKDKEVIVEAGSPASNIRKCIVAPEGRYVVSMDFCVSPETTVELQDGQVVPITHLDNNPQMIKTPKGYELAHNFHYTGKRQKCVLTLKSGKKITCSPDHKFLVVQADGQEVWKPLKDIQATDSIREDLT